MAGTSRLHAATGKTSHALRSARPPPSAAMRIVASLSLSGRQQWSRCSCVAVHAAAGNGNGCPDPAPSSQRSAAQPAGRDLDTVDCVSVGMDVACSVHVPTTEEAQARPAVAEATQPATRDSGTLSLLQMALLISPFAFWCASGLGVTLCIPAELSVKCVQGRPLTAALV